MSALRELAADFPAAVRDASVVALFVSVVILGAALLVGGA